VDSGFLLIIVLLLFAMYPLMRSIRVVPAHERLVIMRLGQYVGTRGPGIAFVFPLLELALPIDMRERFLDIPMLTVSTREHAPVAIELRVHYRIFDPKSAVLRIHNLPSASEDVIVTTLRAVIGDTELISVLSRHEEINETLRVKLDEIMQNWGMKIIGVEIREAKSLDEVVKKL
jgi:regulator of protease activity HflC (stomatin/prohibitin superfamily)